MKKFYNNILMITIISSAMMCKNNSSEKSKNIERHFSMIGNDSILTVNDLALEKTVSLFRNGKMNGYSKRFYENGAIKAEGLMANDKKVGTWKFFGSDSNLDSVNQYQEDTILFSLNKSDFDFMPIKLDSEQIQIKIPRNWITKQGNTDGIILTSYKEVDKEINIRPVITVLKDSSNNRNLNQYYNSYFSHLKNQYSTRIVYQSSSNTNQVSEIQVGCMLINENLNLGSVITFIQSETNIYIITGIADNKTKNSFLRYKGIFEEVGNSFIVN